MLTEPFEIRDSFGGYLRVAQEEEGSITITLKTTTEEENYFIENMQVSTESVRKLIVALQQAVD